MVDGSYRLGCDIGGTFTDFVIFDGETTLPMKVPSSPDNPALAVLEGLKSYIEEKKKYHKRSNHKNPTSYIFT